MSDSQDTEDFNLGIINTPHMTIEDIIKSKDLECVEKPMMKIRSSLNESTYISERYITPPFDMVKLAQMPDISSTLDVCIDAMETNVTGFGWELIPLVETKKIKQPDETFKYFDTKTGEEVSQETVDIINSELNKLAAIFASAAIDDNEGLLGVFKKKQRDLETFGNAYLEIERDANGQIQGINHIPAWTIRLMPKDSEKILRTIKIKNPVTLEYFTQERYVRYRRFVQLGYSSKGVDKTGNKKMFFKSFGDDRIMNAYTGEYIEDLTMVPENFKDATEIIHFKLYHPLHEYGIPRWISLIPGILASRAAQILNYELLSNNGIPAGLLIVEGYNNQKLEDKLVEEMNYKLKGAKSWHSLLVIQAEAQTKGAQGPAGRPIKPSIRIERLTDIVQEEGLFMEYEKSQDEKMTSVFRLPSLLVGKNNEVNRSVAEVAMQIVEQQVFSPECHAHDFVVNTQIFEDLEIRYWVYKTKRARLESLEKQAELAIKFTDSGIILPNEARSVAEEVLQHPLSDVDAPFMKIPPKAYAAMINQTLSPPVEQDPITTTANETALAADAISKSIGSPIDVTDDIVVKIVAKLLEARDNLKVQKAYLVRNAS